MYRRPIYDGDEEKKTKKTKKHLCFHSPPFSLASFALLLLSPKVPKPTQQLNHFHISQTRQSHRRLLSKNPRLRLPTYFQPLNLTLVNLSWLSRPKRRRATNSPHELIPLSPLIFSASACYRSAPSPSINLAFFAFVRTVTRRRNAEDILLPTFPLATRPKIPEPTRSPSTIPSVAFASLPRRT